MFLYEQSRFNGIVNLLTYLLTNIMMKIDFLEYPKGTSAVNGSGQPKNMQLERIKAQLVRATERMKTWEMAFRKTEERKPSRVSSIEESCS